MKTLRSVFAGLLVILTLGFCGTPGRAVPIWYWQGSHSAGILIAEDSPVVLEREVWTFDIPSFPMGDVEKPNYDYSASITAEYTLYNPTQEDIAVEILFPVDQRPDYYRDWTLEHAPEIPYAVTTGEEALPYTLRYVAVKGNQPVLSREDFGFVGEEFVSDAFFTPEQKVTVYTYPIGGEYVHLDGEEWRYFGFEVPEVGVGTKVAFPGMDHYGTHYDHVIEETTEAFAMKRHGMEWMRDDPDLDLRVYFIGEPPTEAPEPKVFLKWNEEHSYFSDEIIARQYMGEYTVEEMTLLQLADSLKPEGYDISQADWYNAMVSKMIWDAEENPGGILTLDQGCRSRTFYEDYDSSEDSGMNFYTYDTILELEEPADLQDNLMCCYGYRLSIGAGERVVHKVQAPIYPTIEHVDKTDYRYLYIPTTEANKGENCETEIVIRTPFTMDSRSLSGFVREEDGYKLTVTGDFPGENLYFELGEKAISTQKPISEDQVGPGESTPDQEAEFLEKKTLKPWIVRIGGVLAVGRVVLLLGKHRKKKA